MSLLIVLLVLAACSTIYLVQQFRSGALAPREGVEPERQRDDRPRTLRAA